MIEVTHKVTRESARQKKFDPNIDAIACRPEHDTITMANAGVIMTNNVLSPRLPAECSTDSDHASGEIREECILPTDPLPKHVLRE